MTGTTPIIDVAVVGTGPAGSAAALRLAQRGASVVMIDKATLPRYKTCGGGLLHRARTLLPASVAAVVEQPCAAVDLNFLGDELSFTTRRSEPLISMTMRADLDHLLVREAQQAGATLIESCAVTTLVQERDGVRLGTAQGDMLARFVIAADGANSVVAPAAGWAESRKLIPALEYEITVNDADFARLGASARFDFGGIDAGYAWVFPKRGHLSVGVLSMRRGQVHLREALQAYLKLLGVEPLKTIKHGYVIPVTPRREALARGRVLLVGDAAGLVDPVTAEGITHAIKSGQIAADTLMNENFNVARVAPAYQQRLAEILGELKAARFLAQILYERPRLRRWLFRRHGQALSEFVADVVMGKRSYRDALWRPRNLVRLLGSTS